jgi:hypothetical protein
VVVPFIFAALTLLLLLALFWLARRIFAPHQTEALGEKPAIEDLFPLHSRHIPQVLQAVASSDDEYLRLRVSPKLRRRVRAERRAVVKGFLAGLSEDYRRLHRLAQTIAAISPHVERRHEIRRLWLRIEFEFLCLMVRARLAVGWNSVPLLSELATILGAQAAQLEAAMARLEENSLARVRESFSV